MEFSEEEPAAAFGVFDGMGGEADGQVASFLAARQFKEECGKLREYVIPPKEFLENTIAAMNDVVAKEADKSFNRMGTTAVVLYFSEDEVYLCNVGDSKAYRLHQSGMTQISTDHTDAKFLEAHGIKNRKPSLSQYVGISPDEMTIDPYIAKGKLQRGEQYLICSDGLTDMVENVEICSIMKESASAKECAEKLVAAALDHGGRDNVTVIVIQVV
jgi:protein phosphatase